MAHFVIGNAPSLVGAEHPAFLLDSGDDALDCRGEVVNRHGIAAPPGCEDCRLIHKIGEIGTRESRSKGGNPFRIHGLVDLHFLEVHFQDCGTAVLVGPIDHDLAVEAASPQECGIEDLRAVGRRKEHDPFARIEAVKLSQELVEGLLLLVIAAIAWTRSRLAERIELVDAPFPKRCA